MRSVSVPLAPRRKRLLADKNRQLIAQQPRLRLLRRRLLALGGAEVVLRRDRHLDEILERAVVWERITPRVIRGAINRCHENVSRAYLKSPAKARIATGWALHASDVVWREHSWLLRDDELCETTVPAAIYYGMILDDAEAARFARQQLGLPMVSARAKKRST